jgi:DNA (cytosine-5)-methyltransferase 1
VRRRPVVVDLFSGGGGFGLGFQENGFEVKVAVDADHAAARTYSSNFPGAVVLEEDIRELNHKTVLELAEGVDVLIGSPPCEPFTAANPNRMRNPIDRLYQDERGELTLEFMRFLEHLRPRIFVMENVPALIGPKPLRDALKFEFWRIGYREIYFNLLRAEDYGNPSKRTRVFISNIEISPPRLKKRVSVWEAIGDIDERAHLPNHEIQEIQETKLVKLSKLDQGDYLSMYSGSHGRGIPLYMRLSPDQVAPTVMGGSRFVHPFSNRLLTVREQARLMGFPDDYVFYGSRDEQYNQVGEAVPVILSRVIATYIRDYMWS